MMMTLWIWGQRMACSDSNLLYRNRHSLSRGCISYFQIETIIIFHEWSSPGCEYFVIRIWAWMIKKNIIFLLYSFIYAHCYRLCAWLQILSMKTTFIIFLLLLFLLLLLLLYITFCRSSYRNTFECRCQTVFRKPFIFSSSLFRSCVHMFIICVIVYTNNCIHRWKIRWSFMK